MIPLRGLVVLSIVALVAATPGCGKKGPPVAPLRPVPAAVDALAARRLGSSTHLTFTVPDHNLDGSRPADLVRIDVYALTIDRSGRQPDLTEFLERAAVVARIDVRPPASADTPPDAAPPDNRPAQGATVTVGEHLASEMVVPVTFAAKPGAPPGAGAPPAVAEFAGPARTYLALAVSDRKRWSPPSPRVEVTLRPAPEPPTDVHLTYTETAFILTWRVPPPDEWTPLWPVLRYARGVHIYELSAEPDAPPPLQPLTQGLVTGSSSEVPLVAFGIRRCFALRAVETIAGESVESDLAPPACETPADTFAPAAPTGLEAVAGPDSINLIWNPNAEKDLGGYLVLRASATGETLRPVTPAPIHETTYRDADVRAGVRYVYVVVAVDTATPPNRSAESARVEEAAR